MKDKRTDIALLILRVGLGLIVLFYGSQKLLQAFGGAGFAQTVDWMGSTYHIPRLFASLAIFAEFFGSLGLIFGLLTPVAAIGVMCSMATAFYLQASKPGALSTVFSQGHPADAAQIFYPLFLCIAALCILIAGAGRYSVDARLFKGGGGGKKK